MPGIEVARCLCFYGKAWKMIFTGYSFSFTRPKCEVRDSGGRRVTRLLDGNSSDSNLLVMALSLNTHFLNHDLQHAAFVHFSFASHSKGGS